MFGLLFIWTAVGALYGVYYEGWTVIRSIYFAIAGMSTAGYVGQNSFDILPSMEEGRHHPCCKICNIELQFKFNIQFNCKVFLFYASATHPLC